MTVVFRFEGFNGICLACNSRVIHSLPLIGQPVRVIAGEELEMKSREEEQAKDGKSIRQIFSSIFIESNCEVLQSIEVEVGKATQGLAMVFGGHRLKMLNHRLNHRLKHRLKHRLNHH